MTENERLIRKLYQVAEVQDAAGFAALFADDGYFWDVPAGVKYVGKDIEKPIGQYATAFPDMHRELGKFYETPDTIIVELSLNGTHEGPLVLAAGTIQPTRQKIQVPCCDVFVIKDGKVQSFHCYNAASVLLAQIGVLGNLGEALTPNQ